MIVVELWLDFMGQLSYNFCPIPVLRAVTGIPLNLFFDMFEPVIQAYIFTILTAVNLKEGMKRVSGKIKLMLAQYRELQSFSQFGSDVDEDTKKRLDHGRILMEILKQPQYQPVDVAHQVIIIYAASNGYLDEIPVERIKSFEKQLYAYMDDHFPKVGQEIDATGNFSDETEKDMIKGIQEFKKVGYING